jgi:NADH-quinone oxidoreductase subunit L
MPLTFATYAVGMLALSGFPLFFSGFWSKDEILHAAHAWNLSHWPFYLGLAAAFLTAFYMTRQVAFVFFGNCRLALGKTTESEQRTVEHAGLPAKEHPQSELPSQPHESPANMVSPLLILAFFSVFLGFIGTPAWPWFQAFLNDEAIHWEVSKLTEPGVLLTMSLSALVAFAGLGLGYWLYGRKPIETSEQVDVLERLWPNLFALLRRKYYVDEVYDWVVVRANARWGELCDLLDRWLWNGAVQLLAYIVVGLSWINRVFDEYVVNLGFDEGCQGLTRGGGFLSRLQNGRAQNYLRIIGLGVGLLVLLLIWGCRAS